MEKILFYDLETTGVKYWKNGIHQIAGAIQVNGQIVDRFDFKVRPYKDAIIEDEALAIAGVTREQIALYAPMHEVYRDLINLLSKHVDRYNKKDKFHLAGYNINAFDNQFFRAFFVQNGDNYFGSWFWPNSLDCYVLASQHFLSQRPSFENFQQRTVAKHLGIHVIEENLHDAQYDIDICIQIYKNLTNNGTQEPAGLLPESEG